MTANEVWLITGIPGAGKSTVARGLAARFDRAVHIEGDVLLDDWVVSGAILPGEEPRAEHILPHTSEAVVTGRSHHEER